MWSDRGVGSVEVELTSTGQRVLGLEATSIDMHFSGGPIITPFRLDGTAASSDFMVLARFKTEMARTEEQIGTMTGTPAILLSKFGNGTVILFSPHPDLSKGCEQILDHCLPVIARAK